MEQKSMDDLEAGALVPLVMEEIHGKLEKLSIEDLRVFAFIACNRLGLAMNGGDDYSSMEESLKGLMRAFVTTFAAYEEAATAAKKAVTTEGKFFSPTVGNA